MAEHGKFSTNHGCTYDPRNGMIAVSDRANHRLEYLRFDPASPDGLAYDHTVDMRPVMGGATLPCNLRVYPAQEGRAIGPALDGPVAVLDADHEPVDDDRDVVIFVAIEGRRFPQVVRLSVYEDANEPVLARALEHGGELTLPAPYHRSQHLDARALVHFEQSVDDLSGGLTHHGLATGRTVRGASACPEQS